MNLPILALVSALASRPLCVLALVRTNFVDASVLGSNLLAAVNLPFSPC